jgi:hypothetical protein
MEYNYITIGYDCSPAAALRNLNLRDFALPFDWIVSNIGSIKMCIEDNFANFHKDLKYNHNKTRLIDYYGFEFPHDYPNDFSNTNEELIGEGVIGEETNKQIVSNWNDYYDIVIKKYERRINRFINIMNDNKPIIALSRYPKDHVYFLLDLFKKNYNKNNIIFINSSKELHFSKNVINCNTEINEIWNETAVWQKYIDMVKNSKIISSQLK